MGLAGFSAWRGLNRAACGLFAGLSAWRGLNRAVCGLFAGLLRFFLGSGLGESSSGACWVPSRGPEVRTGCWVDTWFRSNDGPYIVFATRFDVLDE
jgi:hypothetical protein